MSSERPEALAGYDSAKQFWAWWQDDPDAERKITDPTTAVEDMLTQQFGCHPREATFVARMALSSVTEAKQLRNGGTI